MGSCYEIVWLTVLSFGCYACFWDLVLRFVLNFSLFIVVVVAIFALRYCWFDWLFVFGDLDFCVLID